MRRRSAGSVGRWADARDMEEAGRLPDIAPPGVSTCFGALSLASALSETGDELSLWPSVWSFVKGQDTSLALLSLELLNCAGSFLGIQKQNASLRI